MFVAIPTSPGPTQAELEAVVTLTVSAPERVAVTGARSVTASAVGHLVTRVPIAMSSHRERVRCL